LNYHMAGDRCVNEFASAWFGGGSMGLMQGTVQERDVALLRNSRHNGRPWRRFSNTARRPCGVFQEHRTQRSGSRFVSTAQRPRPRAVRFPETRATSKAAAAILPHSEEATVFCGAIETSGDGTMNTVPSIKPTRARAASRLYSMRNEHRNTQAVPMFPDDSAIFPNA
jgi:hypothetical protein